MLKSEIWKNAPLGPELWLQCAISCKHDYFVLGVLLKMRFVALDGLDQESSFHRSIMSSRSLINSFWESGMFLYATVWQTVRCMACMLYIYCTLYGMQ